MDDNLIVCLIAFWILGTIICGITGMNKRIGFLQAAGIALVFSPTIGIIVAMLSKDNEDINREQEILDAIKELQTTQE